ncbi:MAG TPA: carboxypeptidase-like regulatory domain-containing protein [Thermoanaerobaculia bacterium]|nr:carboxypeptidase-like regulatory domain-containing protein [Thermoanaerobaculia bacterium]
MRFLRALAVLSIALPIFASMTTTALTGRVVIGNAPGAGVTVRVTSAVLQGERSTLTNARGRYWLDALPPGTYDVTFSKAGHTTLTRRAVVELARVARADAKLEPNEDEESVTSTASTLTVAETTAITSSLTREALQRLPIESTPAGAIALFLPRAENASLDDAPLRDTNFGEELLDEVTIVHAGAGAEIDRSRGGLIAARTRSGSEEFSASLRDTVANSSHFVEGTAGGRLVPEKLWFFASAWSGDDSWRRIAEARGFFAKVSAQPAAAHHFEASHLDANDDVTTLHYTGIFGAITSVQALASRLESADTLSLRASNVFGSHVLSAGASRFENDDAFFVNDRWSAGHWTLSGGLRHEDGELAPRAAVAYDLHGNGRRAFFATWGEYQRGEYERGYERRDVASIGFATAIGVAGSARIDAIRREELDDELRLSARYRLFDRFEAGGTFTHAEEDDAAVWIGAEFPIGEHELGVSLLERYGSEQDLSTDLALRYAIPFRRVRLTFASDATNVFDRDEVETPRAVRFWIRATL